MKKATIFLLGLPGAINPSLVKRAKEKHKYFVIDYQSLVHGKKSIIWNSIISKVNSKSPILFVNAPQEKDDAKIIVKYLKKYKRNDGFVMIQALTVSKSVKLVKANKKLLSEYKNYIENNKLSVTAWVTDFKKNLDEVSKYLNSYFPSSYSAPYDSKSFDAAVEKANAYLG